MRVLQLIILCIGVVCARPDFGYNYRPPPSNIYGLPEAGVGPGIGIGTGIGNIGIGGRIPTGAVDDTGIITGGQITTGGIGNVQRHVYVYTAPEEPETFQQKQITAAAAQKHYKIIFIKAPSPPSYTAPIIEAQQQNKEKTLIYVLVKRPEDQQDIAIPTPVPTQPSKPEVYFIRYKTQKTTSSVGSVVDGTTVVGTAGVGVTGTGTPAILDGYPGPSPAITTGTGVSTNYGLPGKSGPY